MITTNKMKPNKPILNVYTKTSYKIYIIFVIEECTSHVFPALGYQSHFVWGFVTSLIGIQIHSFTKIKKLASPPLPPLALLLPSISQLPLFPPSASAIVISLLKS
jgi:hypothetical protein